MLKSDDRKSEVDPVLSLPPPTYLRYLRYTTVYSPRVGPIQFTSEGGKLGCMKMLMTGGEGLGSFFGIAILGMEAYSS